MMTAGQFIQFSRQLFRKKLFWFLVDPEEPSFSYIKSCIENSVFSHIAKFGRTILFCTSIQLFFFFLPLKFSQIYGLLPKNFFPLSFFANHSKFALSNSENGSYFPIFDVIFLFVIRSSIFNLVEWIDFATILKSWFLFVGSKFDLLDYLFGEKLPPEELLKQQEKKEKLLKEKGNDQNNQKIEEEKKNKRGRGNRRRKELEIEKQKMEEFGGYVPYIPKHHSIKVFFIHFSEIVLQIFKKIDFFFIQKSY